MIRVRPSDDFETALEIDREIFPDDGPIEDTPDAQWWIATERDNAVAFAGARWHEPDNMVFLARCGVLPEARGRGLQRRLIRVREAWARSIGACGCYTYTLRSNPPSANNLIACGYRVWWPGVEIADWWGGSRAVFWWKPIAS